MAVASSSAAQATRIFVLIVCGTVLGLAGTDLVLPAIPSLPAALGGTAAQSQLVLAAYVAGAAIGLLVFGELGARFDQRILLCWAIAAFGAASFAAAFTGDIETLIAVRLVQGAFGTAPAVFAPGIIKALYPDTQAVRALGVLGSIEALIPALAPIAGAWLLGMSDWRGSFVVLGAFGLVLAASVSLMPRDLLHTIAGPRLGSYRALLANATFLRYALSHAFTLGGLLIFVFGAPTVIVLALQGKLADFIIMQTLGIAFFICGANTASHLVARFGAWRVIFGGSVLSALGGLSIFGYALLGGRNPAMLAILFVPMNLGLGFRGPPGFLQAVVASNGDDSRGAALVVLAILATTALGTAAVAPWINVGLLPLSATAASISTLSVVLLSLRRRVGS